MQDEPGERRQSGLQRNARDWVQDPLDLEIYVVCLGVESERLKNIESKLDARESRRQIRVLVQESVRR